MLEKRCFFATVPLTCKCYDVCMMFRVTKHYKNQCKMLTRFARALRHHPWVLLINTTRTPTVCTVWEIEKCSPNLLLTCTHRKVEADCPTKTGSENLYFCFTVFFDFDGVPARGRPFYYVFLIVRVTKCCKNGEKTPASSGQRNPAST